MDTLPSNESNFDKPVLIKKDSVLFSEGEHPRFLYIIVTGKVRTFKHDKERLIPMNILKAKDFVGDMSLFNEGETNVSAVAIEDTHVFMIKKSDIHQVLNDCPEWVKNIMGTISGRLSQTMETLSEHRIVDDFIGTSTEISPGEEHLFNDLFDDYKKRRNL